MAIPGTAVGAPKVYQWRRQRDTTAAGSLARTYVAKSKNGVLWAMVSRDDFGPERGGLRWHVSISHRDNAGNPDRCPTWEEMKSAKYQLVPDDVVMVLTFPRRKAEYVDIYPTCLHLIETTDLLVETL